jgi:DNA-binding NtrC family response regulator
MELNNLVDFHVPVSTRKPVAEARLSGGPTRQVLVVDPSLELQLIVQDIVRSVATVHGCSTFEDARRRLLASPPDLLVTTVRLDGHNGLHLVYLASRNPRTRCMVHLTAQDFALAREVEAAGALVVRDSSLEVAVESLVFGSAVALRGQTRAGN